MCHTTENLIEGDSVPIKFESWYLVTETMITLDIHTGDHVIIRTVTSSATMEDFQSAIIEHIDHPDFEKGMSILWDCRGLNLDNIENLQGNAIAEYSRIVKDFKLKRGNGGMAILVPGKFGFGLARMYEAYRSDAPYPMTVEMDYDKAYQWCKENACVDEDE